MLKGRTEMICSQENIFDNHLELYISQSYACRGLIHLTLK